MDHIRCKVVVFFALFVTISAEIYIVTMEGDPIISYKGGVNGFEATAVESDEKIDTSSELVTSYARHLEKKHDMLLGMLFEEGSYKKLYSYKHLINGFAAHLSPAQAEVLSRTPGVKHLSRDWKVKKLTTHTPQFLGLPTDVWPTGGGYDRAGEDIVIGFVDSGIFPHHPSFASHHTAVPYGPHPSYKGKCEDDTRTKVSFCNGKIIGAQHFAEAAKAAGAFNPDVDFASPMDGDGHGSHTAAIAAGNNGIPVRMHGYEFGKASGMAPRARIAVYKALYRLFGGFVSDVVAAIDMAVHDGVDILSLSVGPNSPPATTKTTFLNPFDATLLGAVKAGVFVAQAAGNGGPFPKTLVSYSPWITTVAAAIDDRRYKNHLTLGNGKMLAGIGLSPSTRPHRSYKMVSANDVLLDSSGGNKYNPSDCQKPEVLNKKLVQGNILLCGYSFNFVAGSASIKKVAETAKHLGAAGFVLVVENVSPGTKFDPVPSCIPGILITDVPKSMDLIDYYNVTTSRDWMGRVKDFKAEGSIGDGLEPILHKSAPEVALFSARGPNTKDFSFQDADLLKPDILAPGSLIWSAWSENGTDEANYVGEGFALISGTSMAAPHIAGIAALVKQKHPQWSPAAIKSALMTTSTVMDRAGRPLQAQQYSETETVTLVKATPFDYGSGHVSPSSALDPGLIFDAGYEDYLGFLCTTPGIDAHEIRNFTNTPCNYKTKLPSNFNSPSIAISHLVGTQTVTRRVTNVAEEEETYTITSRMEPSIAIEVSPPAMTLRAGIETERLHQKLILHDTSLQHLQIKEQTDVKASLDGAVKSILEELTKSPNQEKIALMLTAIPEQVETSLQKIQSEICHKLTGEIQVLASLKMTEPVIAQEVPTAPQVKESKENLHEQRGPAAKLQSSAFCDAILKTKQPQLHRNPDKTSARNVKTFLSPKTQVGCWKTVKPGQRTLKNNAARKQVKRVGDRTQFEECSIVIDSDEDMDEGFSCLLKGNTKGASFEWDAEKETERLLKTARRTRRKFGNPIIIN